MAITTLLVCAALLVGSVRGWDSDNKGNPTHATHSYLTEWAIDLLKGQFPELQQFRTDKQIIGVQIIGVSSYFTWKKGLTPMDSQAEAFMCAVRNGSFRPDHYCSFFIPIPLALPRRTKALVSGHTKSCEWGGQHYSPGAWIPVAHGHFCYRYYCQPDGSWRKDGLCW